uniref:RNase H type-1 domain-containing protein n=1 Tax=Setaria viridis TaxID=4556 RepID=A0A4U6VIS8_SETVI|nr:hypothetical protein SEVIR_3G319000v2 [Setaria viridis]
MRVIVKSDSLQLVLQWKNRGQQQSEIAVILEEIFVRVRRSANVAAHLCAKHAAPSRPSLLWHDQPPSFLLSSIQSDCNPSG